MGRGASLIAKERQVLDVSPQRCGRLLDIAMNFGAQDLLARGTKGCPHAKS